MVWAEKTRCVVREQVECLVACLKELNLDPDSMIAPSGHRVGVCTMSHMDDLEDCQLPDDITYEEWVHFVFDHPVLEPRWWWQEPESGFLQEWNDQADPARTLSYVTRLFNESEQLLGRFTRKQIDQGLNFLISGSCSNHMCVLPDHKLPWENRRKCFEAMIALYSKLIAPVYGNDLGHIERADSNPDCPGYACYMWWEVISLHGGDEDRRINAAVLHVFQEVLKLKAESCLESVLHGLGHWHLWIPDQTAPVIRRFLERTDISPELRIYAERAAIGAVQ